MSQRGGIGLDLFAHLEAADLRHHHVQQQHVRMPFANLAQRLFAVGNELDVVVGLTEVGLQQLGPFRIVLGNQEPEPASSAIAWPRRSPCVRCDSMP